MVIEGSHVAVIHNLRFGYKNIEDYDDREIVVIMDYNLPHDIMAMCLGEISRRRAINLATRKT